MPQQAAGRAAIRPPGGAAIRPPGGAAIQPLGGAAIQPLGGRRSVAAEQGDSPGGTLLGGQRSGKSDLLGWANY